MRYSKKEIENIAKDIIALSDNEQGDESNILYARTIAAMSDEEAEYLHACLF